MMHEFTMAEAEHVLADAKEALMLALGSRREDAARRYVAQIRDAGLALRRQCNLANDDYRIDRIEAASLAITAAIEAYARTRPNGRDYAPKDLAAAEQRWEAGLEALQRTRAELWIDVA